MNIAGVLVHSRPENIDSVRTKLAQLEGVEIHAVTADGRFVVTVEDEDGRRVADTMMHFQDLSGVLSAAMVYHQYESESDLSEVEEA